MQRLARLTALSIPLALLSLEPCRAQLPPGEGGYAQLVAQYDTNRDGVLDGQERAALLSPVAIRQPPLVDALPLICDGLSQGDGGGGLSANHQQTPGSPPRVGRRLLQRQQRFANRQPQGEPRFNRAEGELLTQRAQQPVNGYPIPTLPPPTEPRRQNLLIRNVALYQMQVNESRAQARSQAFARAATFGPIRGLTKRYQAATDDDHCARSRASIYRLARY